VAFLAVCILASIVFFAFLPGQLALFLVLIVAAGAIGIWRIIYVARDKQRAARINYEFNNGLWTGDGAYEDGEDETSPEPMQDGPLWKVPKHDPEAFEAQVADMFRRYGYQVVETPYQGDHGIDLKVIDPSEYAVVQCKCYAKYNKVGEPQVRDFFGAMQHEGADHGYIVTTSDFTEKAISWSKGKRIVLVNGENLQRMFEETGIEETIVRQKRQPPKAKRVY